jgi:hypothetical protein
MEMPTSESMKAAMSSKMEDMKVRVGSWNAAAKEKVSAKAEGVKQKVQAWVTENCTVAGRSEKLWAEQYQSIMDRLPNKVDDDRRALIEQQLRDRCQSVATRGLITDGLMVGGAVIGAGVVGAKAYKERATIMKFAKNTAGFRDRQFREFMRNPVVKGIKTVAVDGAKVTFNVTSGATEAVVKTVTWPARALFFLGTGHYPNVPKFPRL